MTPVKMTGTPLNGWGHAKIFQTRFRKLLIISFIRSGSRKIGCFYTIQEACRILDSEKYPRRPPLDFPSTVGAFAVHKLAFLRMIRTAYNTTFERSFVNVASS
jgi:hypothetical protein